MTIGEKRWNLGVSSWLQWKCCWRSAALGVYLWVPLAFFSHRHFPFLPLSCHFLRSFNRVKKLALGTMFRLMPSMCVFVIGTQQRSSSRVCAKLWEGAGSQRDKTTVSRPFRLSLCDLPEKYWVQLASQTPSRWLPHGSREWWGSPHTDSTFQGLPQVEEENSVAKAPSVLFALDKPRGNSVCNKRGCGYCSHLSSNAAAARGSVKPHPHARFPRRLGQPHRTARGTPDSQLQGPTEHEFRTPLVLTRCVFFSSLCFPLQKQEYSLWCWGGFFAAYMEN